MISLKIRLSIKCTPIWKKNFAENKKTQTTVNKNNKQIVPFGFPLLTHRYTKISKPKGNHVMTIIDSSRAKGNANSFSSCFSIRRKTRSLRVCIQEKHKGKKKQHRYGVTRNVSCAVWFCLQKIIFFVTAFR